MKDERDPVSRDEYVLRAIPNGPDYYQPGPLGLFTIVAFQPNKIRDRDGLSVFREQCFEHPSAAPEQLARMLPKSGNYWVVRLNVADLEDLGLNVVPAPRDSLIGHALIPKLGYIEYEKDKRQAKELHLKLVKLASNNLAYSPLDP